MQIKKAKFSQNSLIRNPKKHISVLNVNKKITLQRKVLLKSNKDGFVRIAKSISLVLLPLIFQTLTQNDKKEMNII